MRRATTRGKYSITNTNSFTIELPIESGRPITKSLDGLLDQNIIKDYENNSTDTIVNFKVTLNREQSVHDLDIDKVFKLTSGISMNNMHLFNVEGKLCNYKTPLDIIEEFTANKLIYYNKRKEYLLKVYRKELHTLSEKIRFMLLVIENKIVVFKRTVTDIKQQLKSHAFSETLFDTLLGIKLYAFTHENISELQKKIESVKQNVNHLQTTTIEKMWTMDIKNLKL